jgi:type II secretory pathway pseudopilin PulG
MTNKVLPRDSRGACAKLLTYRLDGRRHQRHYNAFTLIELIVVIGIIIVLAGLVLSTAGYARKKSARARAETEIAAMSAACENYKADNGVYPRGNADLSNNTPYDTDTLDPLSNVNPAATPIPNVYTKASLYLYKQLSGDTTGNRQPSGKSYMAFKPNMLLPGPPSTAPVIAIADPFGNSYGYSTKKASDPTANGYNPTFDMWSTAGDTSGNQNIWIKNW